MSAYVGTYTPYSQYDSYSRGNPVTLGEDGVVTGGETNGRSQASVVPNNDGTISIIFNAGERYTVYPVGVSVPSGGSWIDTTQVNIEYLYTAGGTMNIVYDADPASLGTP